MSNYTKKEISDNIKKYTDKIAEIKIAISAKRKDLNSSKEQLEYWNNLNPNQLNIFK